MNDRVHAAQILKAVMFEQRSLSEMNGDKALMPVPMSALTQELVYGALRFFPTLKAISQQLLLKPLPSKCKDVLCLLIVGLYQLNYLNIPDYAAVSETVNAAKAMGRDAFTGLLNKTLKRFIQEKEEILEKAQQKLDARYAHPTWFIKKVKAAWPEQWQAILTANNTMPLMVLRVNRTKISRDDYLKKLHECHIEAKIFPALPEAIQLSQSCPVADLPGFQDGLCYVQDLAGQFAAHLLELKPNLRVLDVCAAPGSKTTHMMELVPKLKSLVAIDQVPNRLIRIKENVERLQLPHTMLKLILADAAHSKEWWDGEKFDRILLDAPCSSTGVIRRHPDIKYLRTEEDIERQAALQKHLLKAVWPLLKPNGYLLYSTCSILPDENEAVIHQFCHEHKDAKCDKLDLPIGLRLQHGVQIFPDPQGTDGFYYARIRKG